MICQNWFHCESAASFGEISQIYRFTKALYWHILPHVVLDTAYTAGCSGLVVSVSDWDLMVLWICLLLLIIIIINWMPSVLWRCWLGGRKGIRPVKKLGAGVLVWLSICLERGADLHMAQLMPLPLTVSCFSKIQIGFTFLVPAYPDSPGQRAVNVCSSSVIINWLVDYGDWF